VPGPHEPCADGWGVHREPPLLTQDPRAALPAFSWRLARLPRATVVSRESGGDGGNGEREREGGGATHRKTSCGRGPPCPGRS
jgi:hypothetical protein